MNQKPQKTKLKYQELHRTLIALTIALIIETGVLIYLMVL